MTWQEMALRCEQINKELRARLERAEARIIELLEQQQSMREGTK